MATDINSADGRKHRKRKPRPTVGDASTSTRSEAMRRRFADPEQRRRLSEITKERWRTMPEKMGRKLGQWDGLTKEECARINAEAKARANRIIEKMKDNGSLSPDDDPRAVKALEAAIEVMGTPQSQSLRLQAARIILEYTKSKPVAKSEITVNKAEEWLASIAEDDDKDNDGVSADDAETTA